VESCESIYNSWVKGPAEVFGDRRPWLRCGRRDHYCMSLLRKAELVVRKTTNREHRSRGISHQRYQCSKDCPQTTTGDETQGSRDTVYCIFLNNRIHNVSETGSVSFFRWGKEGTCSVVGPLESASLNQWTTDQLCGDLIINRRFILYSNNSNFNSHREIESAYPIHSTSLLLK
jgi:hypothetical protein